MQQNKHMDKEYYYNTTCFDKNLLFLLKAIWLLILAIIWYGKNVWCHEKAIL